MKPETLKTFALVVVFGLAFAFVVLGFAAAYNILSSFEP